MASVAVAVIAAGAAYAPPRVKLIGLYLPLVGGIMAVTAVLFAHRIGFDRRSFLRTAVPALCGLGLLVQLYLTAAAMPPPRSPDPSQQMAANMLARLEAARAASEASSEVDGGVTPTVSAAPTTAPFYAVMRYLEARLPRWQRPYPQLAWLAEWLVAVATAAVLTVSMTASPPAEESTP